MSAWKKWFSPTKEPGVFTCKLCVNKDVKSGDSGTSNLKSHFRVHHHEMYTTICIAEAEAKAKAKGGAPSTKKKQQVIDEKVDDAADLPFVTEPQPNKKSKPSTLFSCGIYQYMTIPPTDNSSDAQTPESSSVIAPPTFKQVALGEDIVEFFIKNSDIASLDLLHSELFWRLIRAKKHDKFATPEKVVAVIKGKAEEGQLLFKQNLYDATSVALSIQLTESENRYTKFLTMTVRFFVNNEEMRATLSHIDADLTDTQSEMETFLMSTMASWEMDSSKVTGVVIDPDKKYLYEASVLLFPNAGITSCIFKACDQIQQKFDILLANTDLIKQKLTPVYQNIVENKEVMDQLSEQDQISLRTTKMAHERIAVFAALRNKICSSLSAVDAYHLTRSMPSPEDFDQLQMYANAGLKFRNDIHGVIRHYKIVPCSLFIGLKEYIHNRVKIICSAVDEAFKLFIPQIEEVAKKVLVHGNDVHLHVMSLLDDRAKDMCKMSGREQQAVYRILEDEISRVQAAAANPVPTVTSEPSFSFSGIKEYRTEYRENSDNIRHATRLESEFGMSIPLKAYFKENDGYMLEDPGCFMKLWHGKQKHVLYALAMKFAPALSIIFGPESLALCGSRFLEKDDLESHRENLVFLRK